MVNEQGKCSTAGGRVDLRGGNNRLGGGGG